MSTPNGRFSIWNDKEAQVGSWSSGPTSSTGQTTADCVKGTHGWSELILALGSVELQERFTVKWWLEKRL